MIFQFSARNGWKTIIMIWQRVLGNTFLDLLPILLENLQYNFICCEIKAFETLEISSEEPECLPPSYNSTCCCVPVCLVTPIMTHDVSLVTSIYTRPFGWEKAAKYSFVVWLSPLCSLRQHTEPKKTLTNIPITKLYKQKRKTIKTTKTTCQQCELYSLSQ